MTIQAFPTRSLTFTQYLRPDGRQQPVSIDVPQNVYDAAAVLQSRGLRFECEMLTTGEVSLTIHDPIKEQDVDSRVVPNGPGVPGAVHDLILNFKG
jgi:hypothetical protein